LWVCNRKTSTLCSRDLVQTNNTCEREQPNKEGNQSKEEVENWYTDNSLVLDSEISSGINDVDGLFDVFVSTNNAKAEAASNGSKSNATN
jgi:hypothetical protein